MPTDITPHPTSARNFVLRGVAASLGLFALLRFAWIEAHLVLPFTQTQAALAARGFGAPASPVAATLACSGTDALALCLGAVLAYPAAWRRRLAGVAGGAILIVSLNTMRIGTLGLVAASPRWFTALHLYVWPAVLTLAIAGYVFAWMRSADRADPQSLLRAVPQPSRRFIILDDRLSPRLPGGVAVLSRERSRPGAGEPVARAARPCSASPAVPRTRRPMSCGPDPRFSVTQSASPPLIRSTWRRLAPTRQPGVA